MGRMMGIEPTNVGATIRCVNHFATFAMAGVVRVELTSTVLETAVLPLNYTPYILALLLYQILNKKASIFNYIILVNLIMLLHYPRYSQNDYKCHFLNLYKSHHGSFLNQE
jgi:hypothetical protein